MKTSKLAVLLNKPIAVLTFSLLNSLISYIRLHSSCILQGGEGGGFETEVAKDKTMFYFFIGCFIFF